MLLLLITGLLAISRTALAQDAFCTAVNTYIPPDGTCYPSASVYCSSLLSIPASTTATITETATATSASDTTTITDSVTETITETHTEFTTTTVTETGPTAACATTAVAAAKRYAAAGPVLRRQADPKPPCLDLFPDNCAIEPACSCLSIPIATTISSTTTSTTTIFTEATTTTTTTITNTEQSTTTITSTVTTTETPSPTNPTGLQYQVFRNKYPASGREVRKNYPNFRVEFIKAPNGTAFIPPNKPSSVTDRVYQQGGSGNRYPNAYVVDYRGYIHAPATGMYTFNLSSIEDVMGIWFGNIAYSGWTRSNANAFTAFQGYGGRPRMPIPGQLFFRRRITQGYTAFRIVYANGAGAQSEQLLVTDPSGASIFTNGAPDDPTQIVQYSCDAADNAPPYAQEFGQET